MDEQAFQTKLNNLMNKIKKLPEQDRPTLERLATDAKKRRERIQQSVAELQESLDYLRLTIKYLVFDLEATRRENTYLRKLVEQANREDSPQEDGDDYYEGEQDRANDGFEKMAEFAKEKNIELFMLGNGSKVVTIPRKPIEEVIQNAPANVYATN